VHAIERAASRVIEADVVGQHVDELHVAVLLLERIRSLHLRADREVVLGVLLGFELDQLVEVVAPDLEDVGGRAPLVREEVVKVVDGVDHEVEHFAQDVEECPVEVVALQRVHERDEAAEQVL